MNVNFKLIGKGKTPTKAHSTDAGFDLYPRKMAKMENGKIMAYLGVAVDIPKGYVGLLFPRSSISKYPYTMANSVGVIDSGYQAELRVVFKEDCHAQASTFFEYAVAQLIILPIPQITLTEVSDFPPSERGENGWGSSNVN